MGAWNSKIYGNDIAMDVICKLENILKEESNINKAIEICKKECKSEPDYFYFWYDGNGCDFAIAYAELHLTGVLINKKEILKFIDDEIELINKDKNKKELFNSRKEVLNRFKNEIESNNVKAVKDINKWFKNIHEEDII
jgi:hypothetical protein